MIIFYHTHTLAYYCWNDYYPVGLNGGSNISQDPWEPDGNLSEKDLKFFTELETSKKRTFELKGRGKFVIVQRLKRITNE